MTPQEYIDALAANPDDRERLLQQAKRELDAAQLEEVANFFLRGGDAVLGGSISDIANDKRTATTERQAVTDKGSAIVAAAEEQGATEAEKIKALEAEGLDPGEFGIDLSDPRWMLDSLGRPLTPDERNEFLEIYNGTQGTDFDSFEELVATGAIDQPADQVSQLVELAVGEKEPFPSLTISLAKGRQFSVRSDEWEEASKRYGYDSDAMTRIVRMADLSGMRGADGEYIAWQPLAALLKASGYQQYDDKARGDAARFRELSAEITKLERLVNSGAPSYATGDAAKKLSELKREQMVLRGNLAVSPTQAGAGTPRDLAKGFNEGLAKFDYDAGMAYIHAQDPGLAARIAATKGDNSKLSGQDRALMSRYVGNGGYRDADDFIVSMLQQGYAEADTTGSLVANYLKALELAGGGGSGRQRIIPDPVQVEQSAKDLYRSLFLEDPDDRTLGQLTSMVSSAISSAPEDQNVDIEARIRQGLEGTSQYQKYYGQKPGGMTEAEYRTQFGAAQQSILGNETAGNAAVRLGMQSGKYQTAVGAATGTKEAWDNSTYLGRLASATQNVSRNT